MARVSASSASFVRDGSRLLLTFASVVAVDVLVLPFFTHSLRVWFPVWLDPEWSTRAHPWVVYSQSYLAGIYLIPLLAYLIARDFLGTLSAALRTGFWAGTLAVFSFIVWWKGSLMLQFGKHWEALGFFVLTVLAWLFTGLMQGGQARLAQMSEREFFRRLIRGISIFFLVMSVLDPVMQVAVQHLRWSPGLLVEVGFFVPAGVLLLLLARRLERQAAP